MGSRARFQARCRAPFRARFPVRSPAPFRAPSPVRCLALVFRLEAPARPPVPMVYAARTIALRAHVPNCKVFCPAKWGVMGVLEKLTAGTLLVLSALGKMIQPSV